MIFLRRSVRILTVAVLAALGLVFYADDSHAGVNIPQPVEKIVYRCSPGAGFDICSVNPDGGGWQNLTSNSIGDGQPILSPDGQLIASASDITDIYVMNSDGSNHHDLMPEINAIFDSPTWSPDGSQLAFICSDPNSANTDGICTVNRNGGGFQMIREIEPRPTYLEWNPQGGTMLVGNEEVQSINDDIFIFDIASGSLTNITNTPSDYEFGTWSPDGTEIAFVGSPLESEPESLVGLYKINPNGTGRTHLFTSDWSANATRPAWSPDGEQIAYFCSQSDVGADELCFVDANDGDFIEALPSDIPDKYAIAADPDWGLTGGTPHGDIDCGGTADPIDALKLLRFDAGLSVDPGPNCVAIGDEVDLSGVVFNWGDIDCDELINPVDGLKVLRFDAGLDVAQNDPCPSVGTILS